MIHGIGIDMVDVARFGAAMEKWGGRFTKRLFTEGELSYAMKMRYPEKHLAARFAAKVSLFKALGFAVPYKDVEVVRGADGRPLIKAKGIDSGLFASLTMSHDGAFAIAEITVEKV